MNVKTTKRGKAGRVRNAVGEMKAEYRFDYSKSKPNRFASRLRSDVVAVVLDRDVAKVFRDPKRVNAFLRAAIAATEKPRGRRTS
ncbi:MAG TPA: hypothetical protein VFG76_01075 [Candidatus Polarisedimenticolia bacterium]|nr:hypothetical protein [Candidatus Polarisedimenticolia bacterium]